MLKPKEPKRSTDESQMTFLYVIERLSKIIEKQTITQADDLGAFNGYIVNSK